jgi:hypothetical protein
MFPVYPMYPMCPVCPMFPMFELCKMTQAQASVIHNYARLTFKVAKLKNKTTESCHGLVCRG